VLLLLPSEHKVGAKDVFGALLNQSAFMQQAFLAVPWIGSNQVSECYVKFDEEKICQGKRQSCGPTHSPMK